MKIISVGFPYPYSPSLVNQSMNIQITGNDVELAYCLARPSPSEVNAVQKGKGRFWLIYENGVIIFQFRFANENGSEKIEGEFPFHYKLFENQGQPLPFETVEDDAHYLLSMAFVEQGSNIVKALRAFTWGPRFIAEFKKLISKQRSENPDPTDYASRYIEATKKYSMNKLKERAVCYSNIGSDVNGGDL